MYTYSKGGGDDMVVVIVVVVVVMDHTTKIKVVDLGQLHLSVKSVRPYTY